MFLNSLIRLRGSHCSVAAHAFQGSGLHHASGASDSIFSQSAYEILYVSGELLADLLSHKFDRSHNYVHIKKLQ